MADDRISRMGDKRQIGATEANRKGQFKPGPDPRRNPGGQPRLAKAWSMAVGKGTTEAFAEALKSVWDVMIEGPTPDHNGNHNDPNWRFAVQKVLEYSGGKPKEEVEVTGSITPEAEALLAALRMTPHERRLAAQDSTLADGDAQGDDAAMSELVDGDDARGG